MVQQSSIQLSDRALLDATVRAARNERDTTAELVALLSEVDARRLYLGEGCASLFSYCTRILHLSEHAAYHRIEAARAARQFPIVLTLLTEGALTLTTVALLRSHLTSDNHAAVLAAARHRSRREVEQQVAALAPRPDVAPFLRRMPTATRDACPPTAGSTAVVPDQPSTWHHLCSNHRRPTVPRQLRALPAQRSPATCQCRPLAAQYPLAPRLRDQRRASRRSRLIAICSGSRSAPRRARNCSVRRICWRTPCRIATRRRSSTRR